MGLKLNKISDENAKEEIEDKLETITNRLARLEVSREASEKLKHLEKLASLNFDTGALLYQQEAPDEKIISHLKSAAEDYVMYLSLQPEPEEMDSRFVGEFEMTIDLVICFGEERLRRELAGIQRWQYSFPEHDAYRSRTDFLEIEKRFVADGVLDETEMQRLEDLCLSDKASKEEKKFLLPKIRGIKAIVSGDQLAIHRAITDLIEAHKWEALRGEYRLLCEGLICLPGLMLAKLAGEKQVTVSVKSDYLPLHLIGVA
ncbi:MAG: immunity 49 family protein [Acidobacteria bacterium]|nr:immunity 49 family protein [Acidobacteriota bacterium]